MDKKKLAILTGGKSGLGYELKKELISNGYSVISIDINYKKNQKYLKKKRTVIEIKKDIYDKNLITFLQKIIKVNKFKFCIFINNAGIAYQSKFLDLNIKKHLKIVKVNNLAMINLSYFALKKLIKNGILVNIGSSTAFQPLTTFSVYSSSKIFLDYFTRIIQTEYKDRNILLVHPSGFKSNFNRSGNIKIKNINLQNTNKVAKIIIKGIFKNKKFLLIGLRAKIVYLFSKFIPFNFQIKFWNKVLNKL